MLITLLTIVPEVSQEGALISKNLYKNRAGIKRADFIGERCKRLSYRRLWNRGARFGRRTFIRSMDRSDLIKSK